MYLFSYLIIYFFNFMLKCSLCEHEQWEKKKKKYYQPQTFYK